MKKQLFLMALAITSCTNFPAFYQDLNDEKRGAVKGGLAIGGAALVFFAVKDFIVPALSGKNDEKKRHAAYEKTADINSKYNKLQDTPATSVPQLEKRIQEIRDDKAALEHLQQTVPFKKNDTSKNDTQLKDAINRLDKKLHTLEQQHASAFLNSVLQSYAYELSLLNQAHLDHDKACEIVNQQFGAVLFRHLAYIEKLESSIQTYNQLSQHFDTSKDFEKKQQLQRLLCALRSVLTSNLQQEQLGQQQSKLYEERHKAEINRINREAECYQQQQQVARDQQHLINQHGTMMAEVQQTVHRLENTKGLEDLVRKLDQDRVITTVREEGTKNQNLLQKIVNKLAELKAGNNTPQSPPQSAPQYDDYQRPPAFNPEASTPNAPPM